MGHPAGQRVKLPDGFACIRKKGEVCYLAGECATVEAMPDGESAFLRWDNLIRSLGGPMQCYRGKGCKFAEKHLIALSPAGDIPGTTKEQQP